MGFEKRDVGGRSCPIFIPRGPRPETGWPCVVFLHGVGENGIDGERHLGVGLPPYVRSRAAEFPAVCLFPQCRGPWKYVGSDERFVIDALDRVGAELGVDRDRVYLTGLSQGGCSTFDLGARYPERWAALAVVCGAGRPSDAPRLAGLPLWIFHGEKDDVVPPSGGHGFDGESVGGRDMARLLPHARYTEYPGAGHAIWDPVYADPALWEWLWACRRGR